MTDTLPKLRLCTGSRDILVSADQAISLRLGFVYRRDDKIL